MRDIAGGCGDSGIRSGENVERGGGGTGGEVSGVLVLVLVLDWCGIEQK